MVNSSPPPADIPKLKLPRRIRFKMALLTALAQDPWPFEVCMAIDSLLLGLRFVILGNLVYSSSPASFNVLKSALDGSLLGIILVSLTLARFIALVNHRRLFRRAVALIGAFVWVALDIAFWLSNSLSPAGTTYLIPVLINFWVIWSLTVRKGNGHG